MTEKFEESQGFRSVRAYLDDCVSDWTDALRKFFLHEQGIWVDEPTGALAILNEGVGKPRYVSIFHDGLMYGAHERDNPWTGTHHEIADRFFAAHPEPKPWHDAKPGEVWVIVTENVAKEVAVQRTPNGLWQFCDGVVRDDELPIFSARRIWPVSDV